MMMRALSDREKTFKTANEALCLILSYKKNLYTLNR